LAKDASYTDNELFSRIAAGDTQAYADIFKRYFDELYWNASKILKSEFWAEEIVQEVFLQLWTGREQLHDIDSPSSYLFRITANRCFDRIRRQELESKMQYFVQQVLHGSTTSYQDNAYDITAIEKLVQLAVDQLPTQRKNIYLLQKDQGLSYQEIAEKLGISRNTVRNHMVLALQDIRSYLTKNGDMFFLVLAIMLFLL